MHGRCITFLFPMASSLAVSNTEVAMTSSVDPRSDSVMFLILSILSNGGNYISVTIPFTCLTYCDIFDILG